MHRRQELSTTKGLTCITVKNNQQNVPLCLFLHQSFNFLPMIWQRREECNDKNSMRCKRYYSPLWKNQPCQVPTKDRWKINTRRDLTLSIDGCKVTHIGKCSLSSPHTLLGFQLTGTIQHLDCILMDGSACSRHRVSQENKKKMLNCDKKD